MVAHHFQCSTGCRLLRLQKRGCIFSGWRDVCFKHPHCLRRLLQTSPLLEAFVESLVASAGIFLCSLVRSWYMIVVGSMDFSWLSTETAVCFDLLNRPGAMRSFKTKSTNFDIWKSLARKWAVDPDDVTCLNLDAHFVSQPRNSKFMRKPWHESQFHLQ